MICAFCGTDNRQENKFCGMCGVRLENRNTERRVAKSGPSLTCPSCGHVNDPGHKFCGMCGTRVERRAHDRRDIAEEERAGAIANIGLPTPDIARDKRGQSRPAPAAAPAAAEVPAFRTSEGIFRDDSPRPASIGGPSFLGLSDDSSSQGEYLLEDEGSSGSVLRKLVLIALLAAVGGLVFVQWRSNLGFFANAKPPAPPKIASAPPPPQADHQETRQASPPDASAPDDSAHRASSSTPAVGSKEKEEDHSDGKTGGAASAHRAPSGTPAVGSKEKEQDHAQTQREGHGKSDGKTGEAASDLSPSPLLLRAQKYLLGKEGVKQNCEQGMVYLRAATKANEPAAAMQMGALYASGHCVAHDRVMAYRWFNSAHELEPDNQEIRSDLDHLWAQMTAHERRQVSR